ncbi:hypothetical protein [Pseudomonas fragi]|uniref:Uncharacterized protein n=1 Tax=Pseudomonas fragi TaxID=296 RepID=A0A449IEN0_PSEFR|nr:hypothetical protein [Pseudomonas fragi]VFB17836.1 Uncharacterised protein [Pseudomonas fragi]
MTYEPTQKGNPHRLTVKQHTFPKTSIARFAGQKGNVELFLKSLDRVIQAKPSNEIFCAERAWDQQAESGFMKNVEDDFQALAGRILDDDLVSFKEADLTVINEFYCLWNIRAIHKQDRVRISPFTWRIFSDCHVCTPRMSKSSWKKKASAPSKATSR